MFQSNDLFGDLYDSFRDFDNLFRRAFAGWPLEAEATGGRLLPRSASEQQAQGALTARTPWRVGPYPAVESYTRNKDIILRAELPGVKADDIELRVEGRHLILRGEKRDELREDRGGFLLRETVHGRFERSFLLPEGVEADAIKASFADGILEVTVPAPRIEAGRRIAIEAKAGGKSPKEVKAA